MSNFSCSQTKVKASPSSIQLFYFNPIAVLGIGDIPEAECPLLRGGDASDSWSSREGFESTWETSRAVRKSRCFLSGWRAIWQGDECVQTSQTDVPNFE